MTTETRYTNLGTLLLILTLAVLIPCSIAAGYYSGQGTAVEDITDFGKARLNGEIYACAHQPKATMAKTMTVEDVIGLAVERDKE
jgi:hypothetical protein